MGLPPGQAPDCNSMHVKTGASAQTVQAHARSIEVDQSASGFATQTPAANYGALLDQDTHFAGDVTILPRRAQSVCGHQNPTNATDAAKWRNPPNRKAQHFSLTIRSR